MTFNVKSHSILFFHKNLAYVENYKVELKTKKLLFYDLGFLVTFRVSPILNPPLVSLMRNLRLRSNLDFYRF